MQQTRERKLLEMNWKPRTKGHAVNATPAMVIVLDQSPPCYLVGERREGSRALQAAVSKLLSLDLSLRPGTRSGDRTVWAKVMNERGTSREAWDITREDTARGPSARLRGFLVHESCVHPAGTLTRTGEGSACRWQTLGK
ncbi:hypothetical protein BaRGS_00034824, partial [Batillaria attramentaria]